MFWMNQITLRYVAPPHFLRFRAIFNQRLTPSPPGENIAPGSLGRNLSSLPSVL